MINFLKKYIRDIRKEATVISWPTKDKVYQSTVLVLVAVVCSALVIGALDYALNQLFFTFVK